MKLLFLADAPYIHARRWVEHFVARGDEVHVISFRPSEIPGAVVHHIDGAESLGKARYLVHAGRVRSLVRVLQPDILHALHLTSYGLLGALSGYHPYVLTPEGTDILESPRLTPLHGWLARFSLARADRITASGLYLASETTRYAPGKPVTVVPYGVDLDRFSPHGQQTPGPATIIGTAARFSREKGVEHLLRAFASLQRLTSQPVKLMLAGEGPELPKLKKLTIESGIASDVEFSGWLDHGSLPEFLRGLDIFALPSLYEGFGVAAVEASASGLPVVASGVYGIPDVVRDGETGQLVPAGDPDALAQALLALVRDTERRAELGKAGRKYVEKHYDWRANTSQMERLYAGLLQADHSEVRR